MQVAPSQLYRAWIVPVVLILAIFLGVARLLLPAWQEIQELRVAKSERAEEVRVREAKLERFRELGATFSELAPEVKLRLELSMPDQPRVEVWLSSLEAMAQRSGVALDVLEQQQEGSEGSGRRVEFAARVRGTYTALKLFLEFLEHNLRLTDLKAMSLEATNLSVPDPILQGNLTLAIYYQP